MSGDGDGSDSNAPDDRVYRAVAAGETDAQVRRAIIASARGSFERRAAAVNAAAGPAGEAPLSAAHRLRRGDLVGLLLEAGADATAVAPRATPLVLCIAYNQVDSLRALLLHGLEYPNEQVEYGPTSSLRGSGYVFCTPLHLCITPPRLSEDAPSDTPIRIEALEILLREGGADVNASDVSGSSPLYHLSAFGGGKDKLRALELLLEFGARVDPSRDADSSSPVFWAVLQRDLPYLQRLIHGGGSLSRVYEGETYLIQSCRLSGNDNDKRHGFTLQLLRMTPPETCRFVGGGGLSALNYAIQSASPDMDGVQMQIIRELVDSGVPARPLFMARLMPILAAHAKQLEAKAAAQRAGLDLCGWRAQEAFVGVALDVDDHREATRAVEARRARVAQLEREIGAQAGAGGESESGGGEEESESGEDEGESGEDEGDRGEEESESGEDEDESESGSASEGE